MHGLSARSNQQRPYGSRRAALRAAMTTSAAHKDVLGAHRT